MSNDLLGAPINDQIMHAVFEPILTAHLDGLRNQGWDVDVTEGEQGYLIELGKPGEPKNTVLGQTAPEALAGLVRSLTQLGVLPKELLEMQYQVDHQIGLVRDPIMAQIKEDLAKITATA